LLYAEHIFTLLACIQNLRLGWSAVLKILLLPITLNLGVLPLTNGRVLGIGSLWDTAGSETYTQTVADARPKPSGIFGYSDYSHDWYTM
jgi:hypothetical protein